MRTFAPSVTSHTYRSATANVKRDRCRKESKCELSRLKAWPFRSPNRSSTHMRRAYRRKTAGGWVKLVASNQARFSPASQHSIRCVGYGLAFVKTTEGIHTHSPTLVSKLSRGWKVLDERVMTKLWPD